MLGSWNESYQPLVNLVVKWNRPAELDGYRRELNLDCAVARTAFKRNGYPVTQETYASFPDQIIIMTLETAEPEGMDVTIGLDGVLRGNTHCLSNSALERTGVCPSHVEPNYVDCENAVIYDVDAPGMGYMIRLVVSNQGVRCEQCGNGLHVSGARKLTVRLAAATTFAGFDRTPASDGQDAAATCEAALRLTAAFSDDELHARHIADHQALFGRVTMDLCGEDFSSFSTDERLARHRLSGDDRNLEALLFQYGRYLLIASSRPGCQPASLQGIWNHEIRPPPIRLRGMDGMPQRGSLAGFFSCGRLRPMGLLDHGRPVAVPASVGALSVHRRQGIPEGHGMAVDARIGGIPAGLAN